MDRRVARADDLPPLELRRVRTLDLERPSPDLPEHLAAASGVVRRAECVSPLLSATMPVDPP
jgi:hypothetical protein